MSLTWEPVSWAQSTGVILAMRTIEESLSYRLIVDQIEFLERKIEGLRAVDTDVNRAALPALESKLDDLRNIVFNRLCDRIERYLLRPDVIQAIPARDIATALSVPLADVQEALDCLDSIIKVSPEDYAPLGPKENVYLWRIKL